MNRRRIKRFTSKFACLITCGIRPAMDRIDFYKEVMKQIVKKGIDVSKHQRKINWEAVKKAGIEFAILRAGFGRGKVDSQFIRNISECNRLDIPVGVYWFSYVLNTYEARKEAEMCVQVIESYQVEYPVCYDFEYDS